MIRKFLLPFLLLPIFLLGHERIHMKILNERDIHFYEKQIVAICLEAYRGYPYLYDGVEEEYLPIIEHYAESPKGLACLLFDGELPIGVAMGVPLSSFDEIYPLPFLHSKYPPLNANQWFYLGELVLLKQYRGQGFGKQMFETFQKTINEQGFEKMCFCRIEETLKHPLKPSGYYCLDDFCKKQGFYQHPELYFMCEWRNVDPSSSTSHKLIFWLNE